MLVRWARVDAIDLVRVSAVPKTHNGTDVTLDPGGRVTLLNGITIKYSHRGMLIGATLADGIGAWFGAVKRSQGTAPARPRG